MKREQARRQQWNEEVEMMNLTYSEVTEATENMLRELFATDEALPLAEIEVRSAIAHAVLNVWFTHARALASAETHSSEYDRLAELAHELPQCARARS
jgi:hypothetical protein